MKSPSVEWLHAKIEKQIRLTQSYTEIKGLEFVIKSCRLKPHDYVFKKRDNKIVLHRWWFDEFGNSFVLKNKKIKIIYNDLKLDRKRIVCTDLYHGLSLNRVAKMSQLAYLVTGKDEDLYQDCYLLTFLGIDKRLRSYLYWYGEWQQVSPLIMGMKALLLLAKHINVKQYRKIGKKENKAIPCIQGEAWLSCLPAKNDFIDMLSKKHEIIVKIIK